MDNSNKSNMEIALEYIDDHPELIDKVHGDSFAVFWQYPNEVIKMYKATTDMLRVSCQFTDEMIALYCEEYLCDACDHIQNLKAKEAEST